MPCPIHFRPDTFILMTVTFPIACTFGPKTHLPNPVNMCENFMFGQGCTILAGRNIVKGILPHKVIPKDINGGILTIR